MADTPNRVERLLNLLACLLDTEVALTQSEIAREVSGYPESKSARRRAFERDKETLRGMGVPITVEPLAFGDGNETGYRVDKNEYYLPPLDLAPEERGALNVAVNAISLGVGSGRGALMKLGGLTGDTGPPIAALPLAPLLPELFDAWRRRCTVTFSYRSQERLVEAWAISSRRGRWYLVGFDRTRDAVRTFRADRVEEITAIGPGGEFEVSPDFDPHSHQRDEPWAWGDADPTVVDLLVDAGYEDAARDALGDVSTSVPVGEQGTIFHVPVVSLAGFRNLVLGLGDRAEILAPRSARDEVVSWLESLADTDDRAGR